MRIRSVWNRVGKASLLLLGGIAALGTASQRPASAQTVASPPTDKVIRSPLLLLPIDHPALVRIHWQLVCQAESFAKKPCQEMIDDLHACGIHHIELTHGQPLGRERPGVVIGPDMAAADLDALNAKLKSVHMDAVSYGVVHFHAGREAEARKVFDFAKALHLKNIVAEPDPGALEMLDRLAAEYDLHIAILNGPTASSPYATGDAMLKALQGRSDRVGVCADVANWKRAGQDPLQCLRTLHGKIVEVRLSDVDDQNHEVILGTGKVGADALLAELKAQGFRGVCALQRLGGGEDELNDWLVEANRFSRIVTALAPPPPQNN